MLSIIINYRRVTCIDGLMHNNRQNPSPTPQKKTHPTQLKNEKVNKFAFLLVQSSNNLLP